MKKLFNVPKYESMWTAQEEPLNKICHGLSASSSKRFSKWVSTSNILQVLSLQKNVKLNSRYIYQYISSICLNILKVS